MRAFSQICPVSSSSIGEPRSSSSSTVRSNVQREQLHRGLGRARRARARVLAHNVGACGDSLRALAVTSDGYTLDNPYGRFALYTDVEGWRALAHAWQARAREHFDFLGEIEKRKAPESATDADYPQWNALVDSWNALAEKSPKIDETGGIITGSGVSEAIAFCTALVAEQLCFIERVDKAIVDYGETPPALPGPVKPAPPPADATDIAKTAITLVAVGVVGFVIVQLVK